MTGELALGLLLAHMLGDYVLQSDWMAGGKLTRWWPAIAHGVTYTLPFAGLALLFGGISAGALAVICGTHIVIDRYRLAKYVVWLKNQVGPAANRPGWPPSATGYPAHVPAGAATILMIVCDNTIHLVINWAAVLWL